jgi:hypothetical protein
MAEKPIFTYKFSNNITPNIITKNSKWAKNDHLTDSLNLNILSIMAVISPE